MALTKFKPQIWTAKLLVALRKELVYSAFINRDYEGEIADAGDTVKITSIGRPTVKNYIPGTTKIAAEELVDTSRSLIIDQSKYWAIKVDDVDKRQAKGGAMDQAIDEAAFAMRDVVDQFLASKYLDIQAANQLGAIAVDTTVKPTDAYDKVLVPLKVRLDKSSVPTQGRSVVITPELHGALLLDGRFVKANESADNALRSGLVGSAAGFQILMSNNAPNPTGNQFAVIAGTNRGITFADQIAKTEAYRPQDEFSDAVKGLALYGAKTVRPDVLASALVTVS